MSEKINSQSEKVAENLGLSYERDAYIVGDSLSVGLTTGVNVAKTSVSTGKQTSWMFDAVNKDIETLKSKKVMFLLGGTNDIFANKSAEQIIANIDKIVALAKQNGVKVVVGTIPPFTESTTTVRNAMKAMGATPAERSATINKVNEYIRSKYDYIDYHAMLRDSNNPNQLNPTFEGSGKGKDGIHPFGAYSLMRQAQIDKLAQLNIDTTKTPQNKPQSEIDAKVGELENSAKILEKSITDFQTTIETVFAGQEMTQEQKQMTEKILQEKRSVLEDMKKILSEIQGTSSELQIKNQELSVYQNAPEKLADSPEILDKISDLEKRILEIDEQQAIFLKNFRFLHNGVRLNDKLSEQEIEKLRQMDVTTFLQMPREKRLQAVTVGNIDTSKILDGSVKQVEINFSFNGRFNRQLYRSVTAGIIFPPEIREISSGGEKFFRSSLEGEFFSEKGKRLIIRDETNLSIEKIVPTAELQKTFVSKIDAKNYTNPIDLEIATEAEKRGIAPDVALGLFQSELSKITDESTRRAVMEDFFVDIDRKKGFFYKNTQTAAVDANGKMSLAFIAYLSEGDNGIYKSVAQKVGYSAEDIEANKSQVVARDYSGNIDAEKLMSLQITQEEINRIRSIKQFQPNSPDAVLLFRIAAKVGGLPEDWATNPKLHYILGRESNGKVGVLNYTIKNMGFDQFYDRANSSSAKNPIGARSTASGLGQLLLSNVDKYYPNGRKGIGDPINEAVGFMKYIEDRYGNPDVAGQMYGRTGSYNHPTKGRQSKGFREGY